MADKVYNTTYSDFRGVDYTNDASNVWRRRSPSGVNMLPDESGRPFKRTGWEVMLTNAELVDDLNSINNDSFEECTIMKLAWFDLAGYDHLAVFTDKGVLFYNSDGFKSGSLDSDCYSGYDRCFFFEGNGTSAFYIYGNFRMWQYGSDFTLTEITSKLTVPTVLISASALCVGTVNQGYNLLYNVAAVTYCDYDLFTYWTVDSLKVSVDKGTFTSGKTQGNPAFYSYTYNGSAWKDGSNNNMPNSVTVTGTPKNGDKIIVIWCKGVLFPNNVNVNDLTKVQVLVTATGGTKEFGVQLTPNSDDTSICPTGYANIHADHIKRENPQAWVEFCKDDSFGNNDQKDFIKVSMPSNYGEETRVPASSTTTYSKTAKLIGEAIT